VAWLAHMTAHQPSPRVVITALGFAQILGSGTSFYFPAVLAAPIVADTGWSLAWVVGGTSIGLLVAGLISPQVGRLVHDSAKFEGFGIWDAACFAVVPAEGGDP
jgi:hypothetical protein